MKSGMIAAEAAYDALFSNTVDASNVESKKNPILLTAYEENLRKSWVNEELYAVRNVLPSFHSPIGLFGGVAYSGLDTLIFEGKVPWTFKHKEEDWAALKPVRYAFFICQHFSYSACINFP